MIRNEPVAAAGGSAGAFMLVVAYLVGKALPGVPLPVQGAITALVAGPLIAVFVMIARRFSFSEDTIREAGFDPAAVETRAASSAVARCTVGEGPKKKPAQARPRRRRPADDHVDPEDV